jgi:hypothetical protein
LHKDFAFNLSEIGYIAEKRGARTVGAAQKNSHPLRSGLCQVLYFAEKILG